MKLNRKKLSGGAFNDFNNENNSFDNNNSSGETLSVQKYIILILIVYFGAKIYFNIYTSTINQEIKTRNSSAEILNFAAVFVLFFVYFFLKQPKWKALNMNNYAAIILAFLISFLYCSSLVVLENQTEKEKQNNENGSKKYLIYFVYGLYILLGCVSVWLAVRTSKNKTQLWGGIMSVIIVYIILIMGRKVKSNTNITIGLYGYLLLFLLPNDGSKLTEATRNILLVSTFSIFSFLGVRYFTGDTKELSFMDNSETCRVKYNYNVSEEEIQQMNRDKTIVVRESGNNALSIAFISISCLFMITFIFLYIFTNKGKNMGVKTSVVNNI
jgi:heme/copper-type cytochrome/quinol oxidase subunit 4